MSSLITLWDLPLRLFHWGLVTASMAAYISGISGGLWLEWHAQVGTFIFSLLVFRLAWGFLGSHYSRFKNFPLPHSNSKEKLLSDDQIIGHTRSGSLSIMLMLLALIIQTLSGLFASEADIDFYSPLALLLSEKSQQQLTNWHSQWVSIVLILICLHLSAIIFYYFIKKQDMLSPMITGNKKLIKPPLHKELVVIDVKGLIISICSAVFVYWLIWSGSLFDIVLKFKN